MDVAPPLPGEERREDVLQTHRYFDAADEFVSFFRIQEGGDRFETLRSILHHFSRFPYENLTKIIKYRQRFEGLQKLRLPGEVIGDHIRYSLGGTCFSLTFTLETILSRERFICYPVMADMHWGRNVHCALVVVLPSGKFLADPGYLLKEPMPLYEDAGFVETEVDRIRCMYDRNSRTYHLYTGRGNEQKWRYSFRDRPVPPAQFLEFWISSFRWNSMHGLCMTKIENGRMIYVHKNYLRETTRQTKSSTKIKTSYHRTIEDLFHFPEEIIGEALNALDSNMERERTLGLWVPARKTGDREPGAENGNMKEG